MQHKCKTHDSACGWGQQANPRPTVVKVCRPNDARKNYGPRHGPRHRSFRGPRYGPRRGHQHKPQPDLGVGILGDSYLRQVPLPRIPNHRKPNLGAEQLPLTPDYCVANTAMSEPSQPAFLNGATPFSTERHQQRIRILQSLTNVMAQ